MPPGPYGQPTPQPGTDGFAVAALVTGLAQTGPIALVLGIIGLHRTNRTGHDGKGMAIGGIVLGAITTVLSAVAATLFIAGVIGAVNAVDDRGYGDDPALDRLWSSCEAGDMRACDDLYRESGFGTEYEEFGDTCGGRTNGGPYCTTLDD